jgi:hypothetical protein
MAVKIDMLEKVQPHVAIAAGLGGKSSASHKWGVSARDNTMAQSATTSCITAQPLDFMTDDANKPRRCESKRSSLIARQKSGI